MCTPSIYPCGLSGTPPGDIDRRCQLVLAETRPTYERRRGTHALFAALSTRVGCETP